METVKVSIIFALVSFILFYVNEWTFTWHFLPLTLGLSFIITTSKLNQFCGLLNRFVNFDGNTNFCWQKQMIISIPKDGLLKSCARFFIDRSEIRKKRHDFESAHFKCKIVGEKSPAPNRRSRLLSI